MSTEDKNDNAPYPGLRPYRENEQGKFFGRDNDAEILIDKVLTNRLTLLFAASGVGKSSLLQAAVIPHLKSKTGENLTVVYHIDWVSDPVSSVRNAVLQALHDDVLLSEDTGEDEFGKKLPDLLAFCGVLVRPPLVLILDQFEEFFRYQRHQTGFKELIDQLTMVITDKSLPVHLVFSMREDFALELNAFKPKLPTILFENFYRLEKLSREAVRDAIVIPVEQRGFIYEPKLLKQLLADLLSRDLDRQPNSPVAELLETVEPPYLQIVCAHLWELNKHDPEKFLRLVSYEKAGEAKGILKNYLNGVLQQFSFSEKQLASQAFDHLVSLRGVKMAYTAEALADLLRVDERELAGVLERLEKVAVLGRQQREDELWYELYHDMFTGSIEGWNNAWKDRMRRRRAAKITGGIVFGVGAILVGWDYYENINNYHFRLNASTENAQVELWQGKPSSWNFFNLQHYKAETAITREQLEPDKRFDKRLVIDFERLQQVLQGYKPSEERVTAYAGIGDYTLALGTAKSSLLSQRTLSAKRTLPYLAAVRTKNAAELIRKVFQKSSSGTVRQAISGSYSKHSKIISPALGISLIAGKKTLLIDTKVPGLEPVFWTNILARQMSTRFASDVLETLSKQGRRTFTVEEMLLSHPDSSVSKAWSVALLESAVSSSFHSDAMKVIGVLGAKNAIPELIKQVNGSESYKRRIAIKALGELQAETATPILTDLVSNDDEDVDIRIAAIKALGQLKADSITPELIKLLNSRNIGLCVAAAEVLGQLEVASAMPNLLRLLSKNEPYEIRRSAITALGQIGDMAVMPDLVNSLMVDGYVVINAAAALSYFNTEDVIAEVIKHPKMEKGEVFSTLRSLVQQLDLPEERVPFFIDLLKDKAVSIRILAVLALQQLKAESAVPELLHVLQESSGRYYITPFVSEAFGVLGTEYKAEVVPELINALGRSSSDSGSTTINALGALGAQKAIPILLDKLQDDPSEYRRAKAIEALSYVGARQIVSRLLRLLDDEKSSIRNASVNALGELKARESVPQLEKLLRYASDSDGGNDQTRSAAALGLSLLQANESIPIIMAGLDNQRENQSRSYKNLSPTRVKALTYWKYPQLLPYLFPVMSDVVYKEKDNDLPNLESAGRLATGGLLDFLLVRLKNINVETRVSAAIAALRMLNNNQLNDIEKRLLNKALSQLKKKTFSLAQKRLDTESAEEKSNRLKYPINQPGLEASSVTLADLKQKLNEQNQAYVDWRKRRDAEKVSMVDTKEDPMNETSNSLENPAPFIYEYAYAIAYESEEEGIKLLRHNLYKVREAAARGLANGDTLGVELLKKLEKEWLATDDPIERQGFYHAIDIALLAMEGVGYKKELLDLKEYEPTLTSTRSVASIKPRVEWTRIQLQWRVDANQELEELAAQQLPKLLKEYCLDADGTDIKPEECTLGN